MAYSRKTPILYRPPIHEARIGMLKEKMETILPTDETNLTGRLIAVEVFIIAAIGLVMGFLGPFGTYVMPLGWRLAYWVLFIIIGYAIFRPISICAVWLQDAIAIPKWVAELIGTAIAALPMTFLVGFAMAGMRFDPAFMGSRFLPLYLQCAALGFGIYMMMELLFRTNRGTGTPVDSHSEAQEAERPQPVIRTVLHKRLPIGFPDSILALSVEDHYVRVHASDQNEMLLMRMRDAIPETQPIEGMQVHRGWWVAKHAITESRREGRNLKIIVANGLEIPVSRSYAGTLKQMGWID